MELQELVSRARILFEGAPKRAHVFRMVNGKRSAKDIALKSNKSLSATLQDLQKMRDLRLIDFKKDKQGNLIKKQNSVVYEKSPLLKHLSGIYFKEPTKLPTRKDIPRKNSKIVSQKFVRIPNEQDILDICNAGEDQLYEFKTPGTDTGKISKEICAFANTKLGGIIFYGVQDDGSVDNADLKKQVFDQKIQNSLRNTVVPALAIKIIEKDVLGHKIFLIIIPAWDRKNVYQYEGRVYIRQGTNVFVAKPEELKKLYAGKIVV